MLQFLNTNQEKEDCCNVRRVWQQIRTSVWGLPLSCMRQESLAACVLVVLLTHVKSVWGGVWGFFEQSSIRYLQKYCPQKTYLF